VSAVLSYRGYDALILEPNAAHENDTAYKRSTQKLDPGPGALQVADRSGVATVDWKNIPYLLASRTEITDFKSFLSTRKGMCVPFWNPTWQADLSLSASAGVGSTSITITYSGYTRFQFTSPARRDLAFIFRDLSGFMFKRVITSSEVPGGTEVLGLETGSPLEAAITPTNCMISFLCFSRLAIDETPEFRWQTSGVVEATMQVKTLPGDTPA
jgi:hypothetical protein